MFSSNNIYLWKCQKPAEENFEQTLVELISAHRRSQAKCRLV